jgi:hypothetical protein
MRDDQQYEFVEVWHRKPEQERAGHRPCTTQICETNDGRPVKEVGRPPEAAHPYCLCETRVVIRERDK